MNRLAVLVPFVLLAMGVTTHADDLVADGVMTELSTPIGKLLHLKWFGKRIVIDQEHWDASTDNKPEDEKVDEKAQEKIAAMVKRGTPEEFARRIVQKRASRDNFLTASPEGKLFQELKNAAGAYGGGGSGSGEMHWSGSGNNVLFTMNTNNNLQTFRFTFVEKKAPFQEFVFEDHFRRGLRIQFSSDDRQLFFSQIPNGRVRVAHVSKERSDAFQYGTYEEMVERQPEFAADFHSLLEQLGINRPMNKRDPLVIQTVGGLLRKPDAEAIRDANEAISRLGSGSYSTREQAQKVLKENFVAWRYVIREKQSSSGLNAESRIRLKSIMDISVLETDDASRYIEQRKLLTDADYLTSILCIAPEGLRESISNQITKLESKATRPPDADGFFE